MVYRPTARTRANAQQRRTSIESAARHVIARGGFASATVAAVAREAECSAGLIYTYYPNRDELLRSVFARASGHELAVIEAAVTQAGSAAAIAESVAEVFVRRAVAVAVWPTPCCSKRFPTLSSSNASSSAAATSRPSPPDSTGSAAGPATTRRPPPPRWPTLRRRPPGEQDRPPPPRWSLGSSSAASRRTSSTSSTRAHRHRPISKRSSAPCPPSPDPL